MSVGRTTRVSVLVAALAILAAGPFSMMVQAGTGDRRLAVLPFVPADASHPREGWSVAVKVMSRLESRYSVLSVDWRTLSEVMDEHGLDKKRLGEPETLAQVARALGVDGVVSGSFMTSGAHVFARPMLVAGSGRSEKAAELKLERDLEVPAPEFFVDPPVLSPDDLPGLRDAVRDYSVCDGMSRKIDEMEERILELKARYWANQLSKGVNMKAIKFNPGSTITDPFLKRRFYQRIEEWTKERAIPELSPSELKEFAEVDEKAIRLARRCGIL